MTCDNVDAIEDHRKKILAIFVPHRSLLYLKIDGSWRQGVIHAYRTGKLTRRHVQHLQNIQDSRNSLNCGCLKDPLERCTMPLEPPASTKEEKLEIREDIDKLINEKLSCLLSNLTAQAAQRSLATPFL